MESFWMLWTFGDLLVVSDIVRSETARLDHYVLLCTTFYESWDGTFIPLTFPDIYFQRRRPIIKKPKLCLEALQMYTLLAEKLGLLPEIPKALIEAAKEDRLTFGAKLVEWAVTEPAASKMMPKGAFLRLKGDLRRNRSKVLLLMARGKNRA